MYSAAEPVQFKASGSWMLLERRLGGPLRARLLFSAVYLIALWLDHVLRPPEGGPALLQPAAGPLLVVLWLSRFRTWPLFLGIHVVAALAVGTVLHDGFVPRLALLDVVPTAVTGIVGALCCLWLIRGPLRLQVQLVPRVILGIAVGAVVGAFAAGAVDFEAAVPATQITQRLGFLIGGLILGALSTGPPVVLWSQVHTGAHPVLELRSRWQLSGLAAWLAGGSLLVFWWAHRFGGGSLLPLPVVLGPALIYACFCLPPRWVAALMAMTNLLCAILWVTRAGPFPYSDPMYRIGIMQVLLSIFAIFPFILSMGIAQLRVAVWNLGESEHRYRSFVQLSRDAVWRLEVDPPMPLALSLEQQCAWMRRHARVVEHNMAYDKVAPEVNGDGAPPWSSIPWGAELERHLAELSQDGHSVEDLKFTVTHAGQPRSYLASFSAMVEAGCISRLWGVARDVTELLHLNARLQREQERLRGYARQIVAAEEKARRTTAVDLHDGIGQTLAGMLLMLGVACEQPGFDTRPLLLEMRTRLREVQESTRRMISDLSPPGLYDLGLGPALQWLAIYLRTQNGLQVDLECRFHEDRVPVEMRVLVFKLVRELLRNVIKHAGVPAAHVQVAEEQQGDLLCVTVSDKGRGFDAQPDILGERSAGFGLWSIADRLRDVGGTIRSESAAGQGACFEMRLPLGGQPGDLAQLRQA